MTVITDYRHKCTNETTYCIYDGTRKAEDFTPEYFMDALTDIIENTKETYIYITNLDMIGLHLVHSLCTVGYKILQGQVKDKNMHERDFTYLISADGSFYNLKIRRRKRTIHIYNADRLITLSDRQEIIDTWGHKVERPFYGPQNYAYAVFDALAEINEGFKRLLPCTISSASRKKFNSMFNFFVLRNWVRDMREYELDDYLRQAYHGGICYLNYDLTSTKNGFKNAVKNVTVIDKNSMYPWVMRNKPLPYGEPKKFTGKPSDDLLKQWKRGYAYIFVRIKACFDIKPGKIPCISINSEQVADHEPGWIRSSRRFNRRTGEYYGDKREKLELVLTYTDLELLFECYDVHDITYIDGVYFRATKMLFRQYIDHWYNKKKNAKTSGEIRVSKMMLNTLSGNMAKRIDTENMLLEYDGESGQLLIDDVKEFGVIASTIHIGAAITAYARQEIVMMGNKFFDSLLYIDTDSLHLLNADLTKINIGKELGQYKIEHKMQEVMYYKQKMYGFKEHGRYTFKFAGIPRQTVSFLENLINSDLNFDRLDSSDDVILPDIMDDGYDNARYKTMAAYIKNGCNISGECTDPLQYSYYFDDKKNKVVKLGLEDIWGDRYNKSAEKFLKFMHDLTIAVRRKNVLFSMINIQIPVWHFLEEDFCEVMSCTYRNIMNMNKFLK